MSLRPVDMQVLVSRTPELGRTSANDTNRLSANTQMFANQLNKEVQQAQSTVSQAVKPDEQINVNSNGSNNAGYNARKKKKKKDEEKKKEGDGTSLVDISV